MFSVYDLNNDGVLDELDLAALYNGFPETSPIQVELMKL
jgi:hypothetical protein